MNIETAERLLIVTAPLALLLTTAAGVITATLMWRARLRTIGERAFWTREVVLTLVWANLFFLAFAPPWWLFVNLALGWAMVLAAGFLMVAVWKDYRGRRAQRRRHDLANALRGPAPRKERE